MLRRVIILSLLFASPALAQDKSDPQDKAKAGQEEKSEAKDKSDAKDKSGGDDTLKKVGNIATQPARDIGIDKAKIPPILLKATEAPYAMPKGGKCAAITKEVSDLSAVLGPDFGVGTENNENRAGKMMEAGGSAVVNALIPFRGLVREVSGAAPAERRLNAAVSTGLARRGFLRGVGKMKGCKGLR